MLQSILPQPRYTIEDADPTPSQPTPTSTSTSTFIPPAYGSRQNFVPRTIADFGDGGAFPEIHILQYPLDMGRKKGKSGTTSSALINTATRTTQLQVDNEGHVKYDIILRQGMRKDVLVQSKYEDMMEKDIDDPDVLAKPSAEEIAAQTAKTAAALSLIVDAKQSALMPTHIKKQESKEPVYIKYTPSNQDPAHNSGASQRIIRLQEMQVDPLEPPAFKHKRLPGGPPSPPVPIMHSPPRKITVQDQQNWKIPPCVSNWKNIKGYTIPLDKRLAADGRGYQEVQVNDKFAKLSESLVHAERIARTEIETRAAMLKRIKNQQKEAKEEELRNLAARARQAGRTASARDEDTYDAAANARAAAEAESSESEHEDDIDERDQREQLRKERAREIKRDMRLEHKKDAKKQAKGMARDADRDVSEKIALGQTVAPSRDSMFDARLFNQSEGLGNTLGGNDAAYDIYDKALFKGSSANYIYRPKQQDDDMTAGSTDLNKLLEKNTAKFQPDRGFAGAQGMSQTTAAAVGSRDKPVEFERESDPFGIGSVLSDKNDSGRRSTALDSIGSRGHMSASGGGASRSADELGSSSRRMEFTESRERRRSRSRSRSRERGDRDRSDRERRRERSRSRSPRRR